MQTSRLWLAKYTDCMWSSTFSLPTHETNYRGWVESDGLLVYMDIVTCPEKSDSLVIDLAWQYCAANETLFWVYSFFNLVFYGSCQQNSQSLVYHLVHPFYLFYTIISLSILYKYPPFPRGNGNTLLLFLQLSLHPWASADRTAITLNSSNTLTVHIKRDLF